MRIRWFYQSAWCCSIILLLFLSAANILSQTEKTSSEDSLSPAEQDLFTEINQARAHPEVYARYLESLRPLFTGKQYQAKDQPPLTTEEGWNAVQDAINFLNALKPQTQLNPSHGLRLAAVTHFKDQTSTGATGHRGAASDMIEDRVKAFGTWQGAIGENLSYGKQSARERVLTWLIDDGVASRGHRKRLLSPDYKVAGLSCGPHPAYGQMCVLTLAGGFLDLGSGKTGVTVTTNKNATPSKSKTATTKSPPK